MRGCGTLTDVRVLRLPFIAHISCLPHFCQLLPFYPPLPPLPLLFLLFISLPALASFPFSLLQMKMKFLIKTIRVVFIAATAAAAAAMCNIYYIGKDICPTTCQFQFIYKCTTYIYITCSIYNAVCCALRIREAAKSTDENCRLPIAPKPVAA